MLTICLVKLISILLNYKVKDNILHWFYNELDYDKISVGKPRITDLYFFEKKGKTELKLCSIKFTWIIFVFHIAWNQSAAKKFWLGLTVGILLTIILPCTVGATHLYEFSKDWSLGGSQQSFIQEGSTPRSNPLPFKYHYFLRKRYAFYWQYYFFHMPSMELCIPLNCCKCPLFKIW